MEIVDNNFIIKHSFIFKAQNKSLIRFIMTTSFSAFNTSYWLCFNSS